MIPHVENPRLHQKTARINEFSKMAEYIINIEKSVAFYILIMIRKRI